MRVCIKPPWGNPRLTRSNDTNRLTVVVRITVNLIYIRGEAETGEFAIMCNFCSIVLSVNDIKRSLG